MDSGCRERRVAPDGRVVCGRIAGGDAGVTAAMCESCPARTCGCAHLRFTLRKVQRSDIVVRFATGRTDVWSADPPSVRFVHAGCAARAIEIRSPEQCAGCSLRCSTAPTMIPRVRSRKILAFPGIAAQSAG